MAEVDVQAESSAEALRRFMRRVLDDLGALERMLDEGLLESGVHRIGAEQELCLVDRDSEPAPINMEVLEACGEPWLKPELGRFNLEINLDPLTLEGDCLSRMERQLVERLERVRAISRGLGAEVVLTGILPTLAKDDLGLESMTPLPRYRVLNDALRRLRGREFQFRLKGIDELAVSHETAMLEACNTSFQVHLQVDADEFARLYNVAQLVAAPVLAAAANSPLLFGKRLWRETRIALFQLSIDTRLPTGHLREQTPRVHFGRGWLERSALEIFRADIARFRALLAIEIDEDPFADLDAGRAPKLTALQLFNGTVYRWNRPCYGVVDGRAHLRIENRVLPAGPTPLDEVANAAFWIGLMKGVVEEFGDITGAIPFDRVAESFLAAARLGLSSQLAWPGRDPVPAAELILRRLLPLAREGLAALGLDEADREGYLGVIEQRVRCGRTGAQWQLESLAAFGERGTRGERMAALTAAMVARARDNAPVHGWTPAKLEEAGGWARHYAKLAQVMTTELFTVNQDELVDVVASLMEWEHIRHVPVEDNEHRLVGLVTHRDLLRLLGRRKDDADPTPVSEVMTRDPITARPDTPTLEALRLMREHDVGCLPIVDGPKLVGIVTEHDFLEVAGQLLEEQLGALS